MEADGDGEAEVLEDTEAERSVNVVRDADPHGIELAVAAKVVGCAVALEWLLRDADAHAVALLLVLSLAEALADPVTEDELKGVADVEALASALAVSDDVGEELAAEDADADAAAVDVVLTRGEREAEALEDAAAVALELCELLAAAELVFCTLLLVRDDAKAAVVTDGDALTALEREPSCVAVLDKAALGDASRDFTAEDEATHDTLASKLPKWESDAPLDGEAEGDVPTLERTETV